MNLLELCNGRIESIRSNKLEARVLAQLSHYDSENIDLDAVRESLLREQDRISHRTKGQICAIEEIQSSFTSETKPIFIKGVSAAALCNTPNLFRYSGDIDIFYDNIEELKKRLVLLGYRQMEGTTAPHEDSFFTRGDIIVEVHKYFPVLMPPPVSETTNLGHKQTNLSDVTIRRLEYELLWKCSTHVQNDVSGSLIVTNAEMSVFVLCAHIYKNLFWQPYRVPRICLVELLEIIDLVELKHFDQDKLRSIARELDAEYMINYIFAIIEYSLKVKLWHDKDWCHRPVLKLMNDSYSPYIIAGKQFFSCIPFLSFAETIEHIGFLKCGINQIYSTAKLDTPFYASTTQNLIDYRFGITIDEKKIYYEWYLSNKLKPGDNFCVIRDKNVYTHIWFDESPNVWRIYGVGDYEVQHADNGYIIRIGFDCKDFCEEYAVVAYGIRNSTIQAVTITPIKVEVGNSDFF